MEINRKRVIISKKAQSSIWRIYEFLKEEVSIKTATTVKRTIINKCKQLKDFAGYSIEGDYRSVALWNYIIIYSLTDEEVIILNVIHASMHPDKRKNI